MTDAVVVGGGIGGLAAATFLARQGFDALVVEARGERRTAGSGIVLQPNGLAVLDALGVLASLRSVGSELRRLRLLDERLRVVSEVAVPGGERHGYALVVDRATLHAALLGAAEDAGVEMASNRRLAAVGGDPEAPVAVFESGPEIEARLLVGADGQGSVVRTFVDPARTSVDNGRVYARSLVDWACTEPLTGEYWTRRGIAGIFACGGDRSYWYCTATPAIERAWQAGDVDRLRRTVAAAHPPLIQAVNAVPDTAAVRLDRVVEVEAERFYRGAAVLVGDAAHAMAPNLGQGANSALLDAGVLASELHRRSEIGEALAAYDARRLLAVHRVQRDSRRFTRLAHLTRARRLRNWLVRLLPPRYAIAGVKRAQQVDLAAFRVELQALTADGD